MRTAPAILTALLAAALSAGCSHPPRQTPPRVHVGAAGASAAAVLYPLETSVILAGLSVGPEYARLDPSLPVRPAVPLLATNQWPQEARPSITERRRIQTRDRDGLYLFFLHEPAPAHWPHPW